MNNQLERLKTDLEKKRAALDDATLAARRERGTAKIEGRKPDKKIVDAPGKIEDEIAALEIRAEELPYEIHAAEIERRAAAKAEADAELAKIEPETPKVEAAYFAATDKAAAADKAYRDALFTDHRDEAAAAESEARGEAARARQARTNHRSKLESAKVKARTAAERLEEIYESEPERVA